MVPDPLLVQWCCRIWIIIFFVVACGLSSSLCYVWSPLSKFIFLPSIDHLLFVAPFWAILLVFFPYAFFSLICPNRKAGPKFHVRAVRRPAALVFPNRKQDCKIQLNTIFVPSCRISSMRHIVVVVEAIRLPASSACQLLKSVIPDPLLWPSWETQVCLRVFLFVFCSSGLFEPNKQYLETNFWTSYFLCTCGGLLDEADTRS